MPLRTSSTATSRVLYEVQMSLSQRKKNKSRVRKIKRWIAISMFLFKGYLNRHLPYRKKMSKERI